MFFHSFSFQLNSYSKLIDWNEQTITIESRKHKRNFTENVEVLANTPTGWNSVHYEGLFLQISCTFGEMLVLSVCVLSPQQHLDIVPHIIMCVWRLATRCRLIYSTSGWVIASLTRALKTNIIQTCRSLHNAITPWLGMKDLIQYSLPRAQFTCRCVLLEVSRLYNFHLDKVCTQIEKGQWVLHLIN